ncbi:MAG: SurA N-terminal domain-containing protein [Gammaproteobacteria bacterium]|nr:SurA N-terminal domain-containing protein [Gammaproteobacteria bacterium]
MLQKLRDQTQNFGFKVLVGIIIFVLLIFGFGGGLSLFSTADREIASVNGDDITQSMLATEAERERRRMAAQFGTDFDPNLIDPLRLQNVVLDQLIGRMLLQQAAADLGIGASPKQISSSIRSNPIFHIDNKFEETNYRRVVQYMGYDPKSFLEVTEEQIALQQLRSGIIDSAFLTDWELRQHARILNQRRDLAYLAFTQDAFAGQIEVNDEAIGLRYEENQLQYLTEENVDISYVELISSDLINDPAVVVTEEDIRDTYETDKAAAPDEEQRNSRHILLQIGDQRSAVDAQAELMVLRDRTEAGESFAELAQEHSEDIVSAAAGGELGAVAAGVFDADYDRVLWALNEGEVSQPVQTELGYHLIKLESIQITKYPTFAELRREIEDRLRRLQASQLFTDRIRELDNLAFEQPESLSGISEALGLEIKNAQGISRTTGSGIFGNVQLREAIFSDEVLLNGNNSAAIEYIENRAVVARVGNRHEPEPIPLEEVSEEIKSVIVAELARAEINVAHTAALARIKAGESVAEVADDHGLRWQTVELARRTQPGVPREVLQTAFSLERPADEVTKVVGEASSVAGEKYVVTVTRVEDGDVSTMAESEINTVRGLLANRVSNVDFEGFYRTLENDASISRPD